MFAGTMVIVSTAVTNLSQPLTKTRGLCFIVEYFVWTPLKFHVYVGVALPIRVWYGLRARSFWVTVVILMVAATLSVTHVDSVRCPAVDFFTALLLSLLLQTRMTIKDHQVPCKKAATERGQKVRCRFHQISFRVRLRRCPTL